MCCHDIWEVHLQVVVLQLGPTSGIGHWIRVVLGTQIQRLAYVGFVFVFSFPRHKSRLYWLRRV